VLLGGDLSGGAGSNDISGIGDLGDLGGALNSLDPHVRHGAKVPTVVGHR